MSEEKTEQEPAAFDEAGLNKLEAEILGEIQQDETEAGFSSVAVQPVDEELKGLVGGVLNMGFIVLAPNWQVGQEEVEQLTEAYTALLAKYCPDGLGEYGVEISAVMMTFAIVAPRIGTPRTAPPTPKKEAQTVPDVLSNEEG